MITTDASWRMLITKEMKYHKETWEDVVYCTLSNTQLDIMFNYGFSEKWTEGAPFTLWTHQRVYFPVGFDGYESVASAPRFPSNEAMRHVEGGDGF